MEAKLLSLTEANSSFSRDTPGLQTAWDSTSLGLLKACPYKYYLAMVEGFSTRQMATALEFGILFHLGAEIYHKALLTGADHDTACRKAVRRIMVESINFTSDDTRRTRFTLIRALVWYFTHWKNDPASTVVLEDGTPGVELSFRFALDEGPTPEQYYLCGHIDRLADMGGDLYVTDYKTTGSTLSGQFFAGFSPSNQMTLYSIAGKIILPKPPVGVIIDGIQLSPNFARFGRGFALRTPSVLTEWLDDVPRWIAFAHDCATRGHWPMNDTSCSMYGGCQFREACSKAPSVRQHYLESAFIRRIWDPLVVREA